MTSKSNTSTNEDSLALKVKLDFASVVDVMEMRIKDLEERERDWALLEAIMKENAAKVTEKITLDVGGKKFSTSKTTLLSHKGSFFDAMLSSGHWKPDAKGRYFIDRNPELFPVILDYLRTGKINMSRYAYDVTASLREELDFYLIDIPEITKGPVLTSALLNQQQVDTIKGWIIEKNFVRIYSAINDGFGPTSFHNKCDNKGRTILVVRTVEGMLLGGYASESWDSTTKYKNAPESFSFNLSLTIPVTMPQDMMVCTPTTGPSFSRTNNLVIYPNIKSPDIGIAIVPKPGQPTKFIPREAPIHFRISDVEVFQVS